MNVATEKQVQIIRPLAEYSDNARIQRVAAYCRVSTDSDDQVNSFLNQVRYYTDFIRTNDKMELVDIQADEGITGTSLNKREVKAYTHVRANGTRRTSDIFSPMKSISVMRFSKRPTLPRSYLCEIARTTEKRTSSTLPTLTLLLSVEKSLKQCSRDSRRENNMRQRNQSNSICFPE